MVSNRRPRRGCASGRVEPSTVAGRRSRRMRGRSTNGPPRQRDKRPCKRLVATPVREPRLRHVSARSLRRPWRRTRRRCASRRRKARAERLAAQALMLRQIGGLVGKAQGALKKGNTGRGRGIAQGHRGKTCLRAGHTGTARIPGATPGRETQRTQRVEGLRRGAQAGRADRRHGSAHRLLRGAAGSRRPHQTVARGLENNQQGHHQRFGGGLAAFPPSRANGVCAVPRVFRRAGQTATGQRRQAQACGRTSRRLRVRAERRLGGLAGGGPGAA